MKDISNQNFGILIAYILPGFVVLSGISCSSTTVQGWLAMSPQSAPTIAGFLYVTIASLGLGVVTNTLRRHTLDPLHHLLGIKKTDWNYADLQKNIAAIEFVIANQFRFYQFHGNLFLALAFTFIAYCFQNSEWSCLYLVCVLLVEAIVFLGSRDNIRNYYLRLEEILGSK